jgi:hypothetical protein
LAAILGSGKTGRRPGDVREIEIVRLKEPPKEMPEPAAFRVLPEGFGYIDLTRLIPSQIDDAFNAVRNAPAIVFDICGVSERCVLSSRWLTSPTSELWQPASRLRLRRALIRSRTHM